MNVDTDCDLLVVGGGINGAGIARDAAGRGLRVVLVEQNDLAAHTSSASTKLIHGGLRYLEQREFRLVREALAERERLLGIAPHIVRPMRFVLPYAPGMRPRWLLRLGLFVYDHLNARQRLEESREVDLRAMPAPSPLREEFDRGFEYSDCWVEDSRLVVLNALDAALRGAQVHVRTRLTSARVDNRSWIAQAYCAGRGAITIRARALVNAAGVWVNDVVKAVGLAPHRAVLCVKGSHLILPRLYDGEQAWLLQNADRRVVFLIPFEDRYTLVGTTDVPDGEDPGSPVISPDETRYLLDCVNRFLSRPVSESDIVSSYSGVRALYDEDIAQPASQVSRDYHLELQAETGAPLLTAYGGKITTYRRLAEAALEKLAPVLGATERGSWTATAPLPGGDLPNGDLAEFTRASLERWPDLEASLVQRLARTYGTRMARVLADARSMADLGEHLGAGLTSAELDYLRDVEWACSADDVLLRRTRLGLHGGAELHARVEDYFSTNARSIT
ncbi:glycerol-3-phosphate dehydrogenase [bacterium]|nr:MAG: glycerol-3-phosphate dehydrogenase [bacterium]